MQNEIKTYWKHNLFEKSPGGYLQAHPVKCADGFQMSVQASRFHYCAPRESLMSGDYEAWEVGFPSEAVDILMPFAEDVDRPTDTVYGYVPTHIINQVIRLHGGIANSK